MLNSSELHDIINKPSPYPLEKISVMVNYIFDKTKEDISAIPIRSPEHIGHTMLMDAMYNVAKQYYKNGGK